MNEYITFDDKKPAEFFLMLVGLGFVCYNTLHAIKYVLTCCPSKKSTIVVPFENNVGRERNFYNLNHDFEMQTLLTDIKEVKNETRHLTTNVQSLREENIQNFQNIEFQLMQYKEPRIHVQNNLQSFLESKIQKEELKSDNELEIYRSSPKANNFSNSEDNKRKRKVAQYLSVSMEG